MVGANQIKESREVGEEVEWDLAEGKYLRTLICEVVVRAMMFWSSFGTQSHYPHRPILIRAHGVMKVRQLTHRCWLPDELRVPPFPKSVLPYTISCDFI